MPLWGNSTSDESKPKWLRKVSKVNDIARVFATSQGWVYRHDKGNGRYWDEILVAIKNLATKLGNPTPSEVKFVTTSITVGSGKTLTVQVDYNEPVTVSGRPTVSVNGNTLSYYAAGSTTNIGVVQFQSTNVTVASGTVSLSFGATGSVSTVSGTVKDINNVNAADTSLANTTAVVLKVG